MEVLFKALGLTQLTPKKAKPIAARTPDKYQISSFVSNLFPLRTSHFKTDPFVQQLIKYETTQLVTFVGTFHYGWHPENCIFHLLKCERLLTILP
jgi:hypothetical protein